jgi:hypothetical protein
MAEATRCRSEAGRSLVTGGGDYQWRAHLPAVAQLYPDDPPAGLVEQ